MLRAMTRREWLGAAIGTAAGAAAARLARGGDAGAGTGGPAPAASAAAGTMATAAGPALRDIPPYALYVFDNGLIGPDVPTIEAKVALAKKLGFAGMTDHFAARRLAQVLDALDKQGLEFASLYSTPLVEAEIDARLKDDIALLRGRRARIEIAFSSKQFKPSDPAADGRATDAIKRVADWCGDSGPVVSIYPHRNSWTERTEDGVRLARKVGRPTVGTNLNLVHWQWVTPVRPLEELLAEALPHLMLVTINGLDKGKIVPLSDGDFDVAAFMAAVKKSGYKGPVGLQCYSIPGESEAHLAKSMAKWREIRKQAGL
ncbi:MAG: sugar phosphate isomerase/epimerase [Planctomycetes bacterium]|nr:sugar phosphate isomerase/epimerase [Planctomycetota bacterium]